MLQSLTLILPQTREFHKNMMTNRYFAAHRECSKITKYSPAAQTLGAQFVSRVLESYGKFGNQFTSFLRHMSREFFNRCWNYDPECAEDLRAKLVQLWTSRISSVLQSANARLIMSKISRAMHSSQTADPMVHVDFTETNSWFV